MIGDDPLDLGGQVAFVTGAGQSAGRGIALMLARHNAGNAGPNAQIGLSPSFWQTDPADWDRFFRTNLLGVMNCCHAAIPGMIKAGTGRIVTIVSDAGRVGEPHLAAYGGAKAGAAGFMRSIAKETGRYGITANCISLSALQPPWNEPELAQYLESDQAKRQVSRYVIRRLGRPDDVAAMTLFLCSEAASWITGQTYPVNGGYSFTQ